MAGGPKIKCKKCGDAIQSMYRHDFKECKCGCIFIDGGSDYVRIGWSGDNPDECYEYVDDEESD